MQDFFTSKKQTEEEEDEVSGSYSDGYDESGDDDAEMIHNAQLSFDSMSTDSCLLRV